MTIKEMTICNLIQTFPVLLILAQKHNKCLETHFVYQPPSPTQSPEYYHALDALFQSLYGHGYPSDHGHSAHDSHKPCYTYSKKYGLKPCHGSHGYSEHSYDTNYGSHGTSYGTSYGHGTYGSPSTYGQGYGAGYGSLGTYYPSYKKGSMYSSNATYGGGYTSNTQYNRYKVVVKKTRIGSRKKKKSEKIQAGPEDTCTALNGVPGECISLYSCRPYLEVLRGRRVSDPVITMMLRQAHCGFEGNSPKVCCPLDKEKDEKENLIEPVASDPTRRVRTTVQPSTSTTPIPSKSTLAPKTSTFAPTTSSLAPTTSTFTPTSSTLPPTTVTPTSTQPATTRVLEKIINYDLLSLFGETCRTVYNTTGSCSDLYQCQPFMAVVKQARSNPAAAILLKNAHCGFRGKIPQVCCPLPGQPTELPTVPGITELPAPMSRTSDDFLDALPEPPVCGVSNVSLDRVVEGIPAKLGAFPWMALLAYRDADLASGVRWRCGGALLSTRHVLTAAHCIHRLEDELYLVRLGELDLAREDEGATPTDVLIKKSIKHELYSKNEPLAHDVGLLLLERDVEFTALIRPICLPTKKWLSDTFENYSPFIAGWGNTQYKGVAATHLQVAQVPVISSADCERAYSDHIRQVARAHFPARTLCAGYMSGKIDACDGDSGGPLMQPLPSANFRTYFYVIGVVSVGRKCALAGSPGVYARVTHYMPWIEEKLLGRNS